MKNMCLLFILVSCPGLCMADEDNKWFIGLGLGSAKYEDSAFNEKDNFLSFSGGYVFNDVISIETGYLDLGSVKGRVFPDNVISLTQDTLSLEAAGFTVASKFSWEMTTPLMLSAKLGVSILDIDKQWSGGTLVDTNLANDTGGTDTGFFFGAQLQYKISKQLSIELNWDRYEVDNIDVDGIYAKANIHF